MNMFLLSLFLMFSDVSIKMTKKKLQNVVLEGNLNEIY